MKQIYHPEQYWSEVGSRIRLREDGKNIIAGDDEPYYRYKRKEFLKMLLSIDFNNKSVLEIGCGPGGNLLEVLKSKPNKIVGVDISSEMVSLAKRNLPTEVNIIKIDGTSLPFEDKSFDMSFTATVLQHNTDESMMQKILQEICRVTANKVYLFERIEDKLIGDDLCVGRPVEAYASFMKQQGFFLSDEKFINIRVSYFLCGVIRKGLNPKDRKEGEPLNKISIILQNLILPVTSFLDKIFISKKDIAKLEFIRK